MKYNHLKLIKLIDKAKKQDKKTNEIIASEVGLSVGMVQKFDAGKSKPSLDTLPLFAAYFGVDMNYFFDTETENKSVEPTTIRITEASDYMVRRFEEIVQENLLMKQKLEAYETAEGKSYSLQNVPHLKVAEAPVELKKR